MQILAHHTRLSVDNTSGRLLTQLSQQTLLLVTTSYLRDGIDLTAVLEMTW